MRLRDVRHGEIRRDLDRPVQEGDGIAPVDVERIDGLAVAVRGLGGRARKRVALSVGRHLRSEEHTSELQSLMRISYAVFCLKKKQRHTTHQTSTRMNTHHSNR